MSAAQFRRPNSWVTLACVPEAKVVMYSKSYGPFLPVTSHPVVKSYFQCHWEKNINDESESHAALPAFMGRLFVPIWLLNSAYANAWHIKSLQICRQCTIKTSFAWGIIPHINNSGVRWMELGSDRTLPAKNKWVDCNVRKLDLHCQPWH